MNSGERREKILSILKTATKPVSASALAAALGISRQGIVGDIALLRAAGADITATARGYILTAVDRQEGISFRVACSHNSEEMKDELYTIVDQGCRVLDVIIEHPLYGELSGKLELSSRYDVDHFIEMSKKSDARPLSMLTEGVHLHTIEAPDEETRKRVIDKLSGKNYLVSV